MRATVMYAAGEIRVENITDAHLVAPTALVGVTRAGPRPARRLGVVLPLLMPPNGFRSRISFCSFRSFMYRRMIGSSSESRRMSRQRSYSLLPISTLHISEGSEDERFPS
jgi:hypothetical protein